MAQVTKAPTIITKVPAKGHTGSFAVYESWPPYLFACCFSGESLLHGSHLMFSWRLSFNSRCCRLERGLSKFLWCRGFIWFFLIPGVYLGMVGLSIQGVYLIFPQYPGLSHFTLSLRGFKKSDKPPVLRVPPCLDKTPELRGKKSDKLPVWRVPFCFCSPIWTSPDGSLRLAAARPILCFTKTKWVQW